MSDTFNPVTDDYTFNSDDQVQIPVSFDCAPLSYISPADLQTALAAQQAVKNVLKVDQSLVSELNPFACRYTALVNPHPGVSAADLRAATYTAMNQANQGKVIQADNIQVSQLSKLSISITSMLPDLAPKPTTAISLVALAVMAVVGVIVFLKIAD